MKDNKADLEVYLMGISVIVGIVAFWGQIICLLKGITSWIYLAAIIIFGLCTICILYYSKDFSVKGRIRVFIISQLIQFTPYIILLIVKGVL